MAKLSNILTARSSQGPSDNFKNLIINGDMQIAQRSTSVASITTGNYYTVDRWTGFISNLGTWTQSVENDAPTGSGFRKSLKMLCTTADASPAAADVCNFFTILEGQNLQQIKKGTAAAEQLTLSFWVKANVTGTYVVEFYDNDNTRHMVKQYTISASGTWEYKTITFPADTTGAFDNDNSGSLNCIFYLSSGSDRTSGTLLSSWASVTTANRAVGQVNLASATNNYWQVTGVQLEVGDTATPFEFLPAHLELMACQRYFTPAVNGWNGRSNGTTQMELGGRFPVPMRAAPTITYGGNVDAQNLVGQFGVGEISASALQTSVTSKDAGYVTVTVSGGTNGSIAVVGKGPLCSANAEL